MLKKVINVHDASLILDMLIELTVNNSKEVPDMMDFTADILKETKLFPAIKICAMIAISLPTTTCRSFRLKTWMKRKNKKIIEDNFDLAPGGILSCGRACTQLVSSLYLTTSLTSLTTFNNSCCSQVDTNIRVHRSSVPSHIC
ncbi:Dimer Tnp hAT domain-containing protein, partial [Aphis craccivora]